MAAQPSQRASFQSAHLLYPALPRPVLSRAVLLRVVLSQVVQHDWPGFANSLLHFAQERSASPELWLLAQAKAIYLKRRSGLLLWVFL